MNIKKIAQSAGLVLRRDSRMKVVQKGRKTLQFDFLGNELEKRQLLATFSYSSNLLTIQTDSANEQLSIISNSEAGNYTITTSGTWSGSSVSGLSNTTTELFVDQPSGLASILINDNGGTVSGSAFSFGSSSANFVDDLTVNFTNATAGSITIGNTTRFIGSSSVSLTGQKVTVTAGISTVDGNLSLTATGATGVNGIKGVSITGATVTTANGLLTINGTSCGTGYGGMGVSVSSSSVVSATGSGNITIIGTVATGTEYVFGYGQDGSSISRVNTGTLTINGTACGTGGNVRGLDLYGSTVEATGTGNIIINANVTGDGWGVYFGYTNLKTANGGITIDSFSQAGPGIYAPHSFVFANGTGAININSRSGGSTGIQLDDATFTTNNGPIALNAVSLAGGMDAQIYSGSKFLANNSGTVSLTANNIYFQTTDNNITAASLSILTRGRGFNLGGAGNTTLLGLTQTALNQFHTPNLTLGNGSTGNISLASSVTWTSNLSMYSGVPIVGTVSNSSHTFTQGSNTLTATGAISATYINLLEVTTNADSGAGSLRSVVAYAASHAGDDVITFSPSISSPITLTTPITINDGTGNLTITGLGASNLTISGGSATGLFNVQSKATLTDMTFSGATGTGLTSGGAFYSSSNLGLTNVVINTSTAAQGAAVYQTGGSLVITTSSIVNSVYVTAGANYTVIGGSLGTAVSINSGNQVSITGLTQDITLGSVNAGGLTLTTNSTANAINVTGPVGVTGPGAISLTGRNIAVTGNITSQAGDITLYGNGGGSYQAGSFDGVCISGAGVNVNTTSGNITIDGRGASGSTNSGVNLTSSKVQAGGSGCVTIMGVSGNGTNNAYGIYAFGATVTTSSGCLTLNGTSNGTGVNSVGVFLGTFANISAMGAGNVRITGTAASGTDYAYGTYAFYSKVTTNTGAISVNGTSYGSTLSSAGASLIHANFSATGTGNVFITGLSAIGASGSYGIIAIGTSVSTSTGSIVVNGTSCGTGSTSYGVYLQSSNLRATGAGNLTITGAAANGTDYAYGIVVYNNSNVSTNTGLITVNGTSCGTGNYSIGVILGGSSNISTTGSGNVAITGIAANGTDGAVGIDINASNVTTSSGAIIVNGTSCGTGLATKGVYLINSNLVATGVGAVTITGTAANGTDDAMGIYLYSACVTSSTGSLSVNGTSCGTLRYSSGVYLRYSNMTSTSGVGNVTITGTAASGTDVARGLHVNRSNVTTSSGTVILNGTSSGTGAGSRGVSLYSNANISGTGVGDVTITGTAANGTNNAYGIYLYNSSIVSTSSGSLSVNGTSCVTGTNSQGIYLYSSANISATGAGNVTITGIAANGTGDAYGISVLASSVSSHNGTVDFVGISRGVDTHPRGVSIRNSTISATGSGNMSISGSAMNGTDQACGILSEGATILANNGTLMLNGTACSTGYGAIYGLSLANSNISATGAGDASFTGSALGGGGDFFGIYSSGTRLASTTGSLSINTTSCGTYGNIAGLYLENSSSVFSSGSSNVAITGITPLENITSVGINIFDPSSSIYSGGGLITLTAKSLNLAGSVNATSAGNVLIQTLGAGVNLGGADSSANLGLTSAEIGQITANMLTIGDSTSGNIAISDTIAFGNLTLRTGGLINETGAGQLSVTGTANFVAIGNITLNNATNDFGTVNANGTNVSISVASNLSLGTVRANNLSVNLTGGAVTQTSGANIILSGTAGFAASGNITLSNATNNFGTVTVNGANITINDVDGVNIGNIQSSGNLTITSGGTTNLGANITTSGDQLFNSPAMLTNNVTLRTTSNGNATFASTLNGAYTLTANLGLGSLVNLGAVGSSTTLNLVSVGSISGSDLNLTIATGAVIGSITGSGSNNTITVQSLANETANIVISGTNSGNITTSAGTSVGSFSGITRLVGGAGKDTFKFVNNSALLNGTIDGGSGTNALNYSGTTKPTFINLGTGQATGVTSTTSTGVVTNVQNVFGGTGNDFLTGSASSNVMDGGAGDDTMSGLGGNDIMVGNYGADNMNGGAGIDILIGGYVDFIVGSLQEGLESIMDSWTHVTDGTFNAVSHTIGTASSTQPRLVGDTNLASTYLLQTVFNDQATDRLTDIASSTTPSWFFATERVTQGNDVVLAGTTFTVSKKTVTSKRGRTPR